MSNLENVTLVRAGGGESFDFGGGSGFSDGSSSGFYFLPLFLGGGSGNFIFFIILFVFIIPAIIRKFGPRVNKMQPMSAIDYNTGINDYNSDISPILKQDPDFNEQRFIDNVSNIFVSIQKAWSQRNLNPVRGFMSNEQFNRFNTQINELKANHQINVLENIVIGNIKIADVKADENFQTIKVSINAAMKDYMIDEASKRKMSGDSNNSHQFMEYWTFIRSADKKTEIDSEVSVKLCPNCGAPLDVNESGKCNYCQAPVVSGSFDWVLSAIAQVNA